MFGIAKERKVLMWTVFLLSAIQIPQYALTTGIDLLSKVFPQYSLATIQTVVLSPSLLAAVGGVASALLIRYHKLTKRNSVLIGLSLVALTGLLTLAVHTAFWQLVMFSILIGMGMGFFIPSTVSIMFDNFKERERQIISGVSLSFVNGGCILMSIIGGLLFTLAWYGGYIVMLIALPVLLMAFFAIPKDKRPPVAAGGPIRMATRSPATRSPATRSPATRSPATRSPATRSPATRSPATALPATRLPADVYYYSAVAFIFMLIYTVTNSNLAPHLASANLGNSATAGVATGIMMGGGIIAGALFTKCSSILKDHMITLSFVFIFIGFTVLSLFKSSLIADFAAILLVGMPVSMLIPQCMFNISNVVDETNSSTSTMIFSSIAPGTAGFLSSIIFTPLTAAFGNNTTEFRFQFVGFVALALAVLFFLNTVRRARRKRQPNASGQV
jgi:MFS family permease